MEQIDVSTTPVLLAWSTLDELSLSPKYAWLSLPGVVFVQLPQSLDRLYELVQRAAQPAKADSRLKLLTTALGQWEWALGELQVCQRKGDAELFQRRVIELRSFA